MIYFRPHPQQTLHQHLCHHHQQTKDACLLLAWSCVWKYANIFLRVNYTSIDTQSRLSPTQGSRELTCTRRMINISPFANYIANFLVTNQDSRPQHDDQHHQICHLHWEHPKISLTQPIHLQQTITKSHTLTSKAITTKWSQAGKRQLWLAQYTPYCVYKRIDQLRVKWKFKNKVKNAPWGNLIISREWILVMCIKKRL